MEFPGCDAAAGGRGASERVATLWRDLHERYIIHSPNYSPLQLYRIKTAFILDQFKFKKQNAQLSGIFYWYWEWALVSVFRFTEGFRSRG